MSETTDGSVVWAAIQPLRLIGAVTAAVNAHSFVATPLRMQAVGLPGDVAVISIRNNISAGTAIDFDDGLTTATAPFEFDTVANSAWIFIQQVIAASTLKFTVLNIGYQTIQITNNSGLQGNIVKTGDIALPAAFVIQNFTGSSATDSSAGYLDGGTLSWISGANAGVSMEIKSYITDGSIVTLWLGMNYQPAAGDTFFYYPGCDKRRETCLQKFNNILNFRGEPDMPGLDLALGYPEAP